MTELARDLPISRPVLWFGFLGGAVAWLAHLLLAYLFSQWGCVTDFPGFALWGVSGAAWVLIAATLLPVAACAASALTARRCERELEARAAQGEVPADPRGAALYMARAGVMAGLLFTVVILFQSIPILYYLNDC